MVRHVLLLQLPSGATFQDVEGRREAIISLVGLIPGLGECRLGENLAPSERCEGITQGFKMGFVDRKSLHAYGPHPAHKAAAAKVKAAFERILVFDFAL